MNSLCRVVSSAVLAAAVSCFTPGFAQTAEIEKKLDAQYSITKATADRSDIVTAGSVLVLQKDSLLMDSATSSAPMPNTYQDGKISHGMGDVISHSVFKHFNPYQAHNVDTRKFVTGEKFWVTKISMQDDGVVFELFSDPILNVRYYADLKFPFPKGSPPSSDQMLSRVAEVLKVQPADDSGGDSKQAAAPAAGSAQAASAPTAPASPPATAMAPIAPPPPPTDAPPAQPPTVTLGQTKDQVIAILGQPKTVAHLGSKEIDYYPDFKVTFVGGRVTDVQ